LSGKEEIISAMEQFEKVHEKYLPKVDRRLVIDLFLHLRENPNDRPMYTIETFTEEGTNQEEIRNDIIQNHKLDYDVLKYINDHPKVVEVKGTYMGSMASIGASYESSADAHRG
jgi:hypothetical protein